MLAEEPKGCQTTAAWNLLGSTILSSLASCSHATVMIRAL